MAYAGARGETAAEMARVLHYTLPPERLHPAMGARLAAMNAPHAGYELHVADALWAEREAKILASYLKLTQEDYAAGLRRAEFRNAPEPARIEINRWVEQQTNDRIQNLLPPGTITTNTRLVLTNAIYFKGRWSAPFDKAQTKEGAFHLSATQSVQAPLMHRAGNYGYYEGERFQALELPYAGDEITMVVLLPKDSTGLAALEGELTANAIDQWIGQITPTKKVMVTLPRFTMTDRFELHHALAAMGMGRVFAGEADFSGIDGKRDFSISDAVHKAFVEVNEEGTEAAAATGLVFRATAMHFEPPPVIFRADHPFLFLIRETKSGGILFLGRLNDPTK
jgi:serpin B